jgi:hypothetical protein
VHVHGGAVGVGEELKKESLRDAGFDGKAPKEQDGAKNGQCEADPATRFSGAKTRNGGWNAGEKRNAHPHGPNHEGEGTWAHSNSDATAAALETLDPGSNARQKRISILDASLKSELSAAVDVDGCRRTQGFPINPGADSIAEPRRRRVGRHARLDEKGAPRKQHLCQCTRSAGFVAPSPGAGDV